MDFKRIACITPCRIEGWLSREALVWNLSVRGVYVVIDPIPEVGGRVRLSFSLPAEETPVEAETRVAWENPPSHVKGCGKKALALPPGCGLEFLDISSKDLERIKSRVDLTLPLLRAMDEAALGPV